MRSWAARRDISGLTTTRTGARLAPSLEVPATEVVEALWRFQIGQIGPFCPMPQTVRDTECLRCWALTKQLALCRRRTTTAWPYCSVHRRQPLYVALLIAGGVISSLITAALLPERGIDPAPVSNADVRLIVGQPQAPRFWLFNPQQDVGAERPKYQFLLYDLDETDLDQPRRILHIPVKLFDDYILPRRALGPWRILHLSERAKEVKPGHTVFGYVMIQCVNCTVVRYYWIFLKVGESGWTLEVPETQANTLNRMLAKVIYAANPTATVDSVLPQIGRLAVQ